MYTPETPETVSHLDSNLCDTGETGDTPDTPDTVSHLDSNLSDTPDTPDTPDTLGSIFFRMKDDANV
jgi:hypothetical protein